jgi:hypothetical protein
MQVLGRTPGYVEAIVRYVECKCLLGGVTTSQGIALYSNQGIRKYYRGIIRNVEETDEAALPEVDTRISDVEASQASKFLERLRRSSCLLLHLSEGVDQAARQHFEALQLQGGEWAITPALAGIHCAALEAADFEVMHEHGGSMVWSPLSNLLLYGATADIQAAQAAEIQMSIGSDWSPTGSKNLLGELKVARLVSQSLGGVFSDQELLAMATIEAARIIQWDQVLGSIEPGKRADLLVLHRRQGDPYDRLFTSRESSVILVVINGTPRYGQRRLMEHFGPGTEEWEVGGAQRVLNLKQKTADPIVGALTLAEARDRLTDGMDRLPELAHDLEDPTTAFTHTPLGSTEPQWYLVLDHAELAGESQRPHLPFEGAPTGEIPTPFFAQPLSEILEPMAPDPLTVVDDGQFLDLIGQQANLPGFVKDGLPELY